MELETRSGKDSVRSSLRDFFSAHSVHARRRLWARGQHRSAFVDRYLDGLRGIEIGGSAHNDYGLDALNVDRSSSMDTIYKREEWRLCGRKRPVDIVAEGDALPFDNKSVDFLFASHVLEHFPDPVGALQEWVRVARKYVILVIPHRDRTFDRERKLTSVDELLRRHADDFTGEGEVHWSVWTLESFLPLCDRLGLRVLEALDPDDKVGNGFMVAIAAANAGPGPNRT